MLKTGIIFLRRTQDMKTWSFLVVLLRNRLFPFLSVRNAVKCSTTRRNQESR